MPCSGRLALLLTGLPKPDPVDQVMAIAGSLGKGRTLPRTQHRVTTVVMSILGIHGSLGGTWERPTAAVASCVRLLADANGILC